MSEDATAARQHIPCPRVGRAAVASALAAIERQACAAASLGGCDSEAFAECCEEIARLAAAAAEDVRRLVDSLAAGGEASRDLADEVHDGLGHGLSLAAVLAGSAKALLGADRPRAIAAVERIGVAAARAAADLDALLGSRASVAGPDLVALVEDQRASGQPLAARIDDRALAAAQPPVSRLAGGIVRESLTNARKHAPGAPVGVRVGVEGGGLVLVVDNTGAATTAAGRGGRGLAALRRRTRALGGRFEAAATPSGGFRVEARLPLALAS